MSERVVVSADDHLQEPPDLWRERLPAHLRGQAPRLVDLPDGGQGFAVADHAPRPLGILVMAGRSASEFTDKGLTWDDVPVGSYDPAGACGTWRRTASRRRCCTPTSAWT